MRFTFPLLVICLVACTSNASALTVGDAAPALDGTTWVKGAAPDFSAQFTVVEFWATWCPPCRTSIPHLSALNTQYGNRLAIVGISNEEEGTVRPFVDAQGDQMNYSVGVNAGPTFANYMQGVRGIPHAFLVDTNGQVVWAGHPMQIDAELASRLGGG